MELMIGLFAIILTILFPIIMLPINILLFYKSKCKKIILCIPLALTLASIAYIWVPNNTMDLYRHHLQLKIFSLYDLSYLWGYIKTNFEPAQYIIKFLISKTSDYNLLQFLIVFIGYLELFWIIGKNTTNKEISAKSFFLIITFILLSLRFLDFTSGLWFYFSIINFSIGYYIEYLDGRKKRAIIFYVLSILIHTGSVFLVILWLLSKCIDKTKKNRFFKTLIFFIIFMIIGPILSILNRVSNNDFLNFIYNMYTSYFINGERYSSLHNGVTLVLSVSNLFFSLVIMKLSNYEYKYRNNYIWFLIFAIFAILFQATVFVRYSILVLILIIPYLIDFFENQKQDKIARFIVIIFLITLSFINGYRQYIQAKSLGLIKDINNNITMSWLFK